MTQLLLDVGNSRVKWALLAQPYRRGAAFAGHGAVQLPRADSTRAWTRLLSQAGGQIRTLQVCNVAGAAVARAIRTAAASTGLPAPHFARSTRSAAGVRSGYAQPWRLGVDRWLGLIGARHEFPQQALCVISIGTAMTLDLLDAEGLHLGGSIVPGPELMIQSLLDRTAGIRRRAGAQRALRERRGQGSLFAHDTRAALQAGARYAAAALIERALREAQRQLSRRPRLLLAGGALEQVSPLLSSRFRRQDDLVLRGLAVLAG